MRTFRKAFDNKLQAKAYYNKMANNNKGFNVITCGYEVKTGKWVLLAY